MQAVLFYQIVNTCRVWLTCNTLLLLPSQLFPRSFSLRYCDAMDGVNLMYVVPIHTASHRWLPLQSVESKRCLFLSVDCWRRLIRPSQMQVPMLAKIKSWISQHSREIQCSNSQVSSPHSHGKLPANQQQGNMKQWNVQTSTTTVKSHAMTAEGQQWLHVLKISRLLFKKIIW